jgi:hypothetical protein
LYVEYRFIMGRLSKGIPFPGIVQQAYQHRLVKHWHEDLLEPDLEEAA